MSVLRCFWCQCSAIAHELKNSLVTVSTFIGLLPQRHADAEFLKKFVTVLPKELGTEIQITSGPVLSAPKDLLPYLTNQTRGSILFLEDAGVRPYAIDRMLQQLKLAGKFAVAVLDRNRSTTARRPLG